MVSLSGIIDIVDSMIQNNWLLFQILAFGFVALFLLVGVQALHDRSARKQLLSTLLKSGITPEEANKKMNAQLPKKSKMRYFGTFILLIVLSVIIYFLTPYEYLGLLIGFLTGILTFYSQGFSRAYNIVSVIGKYTLVPTLVKKLWGRIHHKKPQAATAVSAKTEKPPRSFSPLKKFFLALFAFITTAFLWAGVLLLVKFSTGVEFTALILSLPFDNLAFMILAIGIGVLIVMVFFASYVVVLRTFKKILQKVRK